MASAIATPRVVSTPVGAENPMEGMRHIAGELNAGAKASGCGFFNWRCPLCGLSSHSFSYSEGAACVYTRDTNCSALHRLSPDRSFAKVVSIRTKNVFSLQTDPANDPVDKAPMLCRVGILLRPSFCRSVHCSPRTTIQYQPLRLVLKSRWAHSWQVNLAF